MRSNGILCGIAVLSLVVGHAQAQDSATKEAAPAPDTSGLLTGPAPVAKHWSKNSYPDSIPEGEKYYLVVRGDTLWDISARFLGSPFLWPQIWDHNKYITDAHWIYPGDPILIPKVALVSPTAGEGGLGAEEPTGPEGGPEVPEGAVLYPVSEEDTILCSHYILRDREDESLQVIGSEAGNAKSAFADRDILYLNKGSNAGVRAGDVYTTHHRSYNVKHPQSGKTLGTKIETTGVARVILVEENSASVIVERACADMHAGDYLKPYEKASVPLVLRRPPADRLTPPSGKARGYVIDIADDASIAGTGHIVSISLGTNDGIAPGNVLTAFRVVYPSVPSPRVVLGELAVLTARETTATAKLIYSDTAVMVGDEVELR